MSNILFIVTTVSRNMIELITIEKSKHDISIITTNKEFYDNYSVVFTDMMFVGIDAAYNTEDRNRDFAENFMPGYLKNIKIKNSDLDVWKVLSIDRFRFWYRGNAYKYKELVNNINWDVCYVSLDMGNVLPMHAMWTATTRTAIKNKSSCIAVKTEPIRTPEILDLAPFFTFDGYVVDTREEEVFLRKAGVKKESKIMVAGREIAMRRASQSRTVLRKSMDIPEQGLVLGILLDKRDEWQAVSFLNELKKGSVYTNLVIVPVDKRSEELSYKIVPHDFIRYISPPSLLDICDEIISFRWDDHYCIGLPAELKILDYRGVNRSDVLAPAGMSTEV